MAQEYCSVCGRTMLPGIYLVNTCRAFWALGFVALHPGLTTWELSKKVDVPYASLMKGLNEARAEKWVHAESEEREQGGIRYRYSPLESASTLAMAKQGHRAQIERQAGILR